MSMSTHYMSLFRNIGKLVFLKKVNFFFVKINIFYILNHFNVLISKKKNFKKIILIYFSMKSILKNNRKHTKKNLYGHYFF
jgi:hypothetical protein